MRCPPPRDKSVFNNKAIDNMAFSKTYISKKEERYIRDVSLCLGNTHERGIGFGMAIVKLGEQPVPIHW